MATTRIGNRIGSRRTHLVTALVLLTGALVALPPEVVAAEPEATYVVRDGDTLSHIALRTGVSVSDLVAANGLGDANHIKAGMTLVLSGPAGQPASPTTVYVVQPGDTLSEIAVRVGSTTRELSEMNGLEDRHRIKVGQELAVPAGQGLSSVGTASYPQLPDRITSRPERLALIPLFEKWSAANEIPVDLLMAIAWQESGWNNDALSVKGAVGIGQIMPATGVWVANDLIGHPELNTTNPEDNIRISARFLRWLLDYTGDERLAIAAYYQGPGSVSTGELFGSTESYLANVEIHRQYFLPRL